MQTVIQIPILPFGMINCFLIKGVHRHILVDTGLPGSHRKILKYLKENQIDQSKIGLIIITHGHIDHFGSTAELKKLFNAPVLIHNHDKSALESGTTLVETLKPNKLYWNILKRRVSKDRATPCKAEIAMASEELSLVEWGIDGKIIHTPGHTPGSISVILANGEAIIMDLASSGIFLGGILFNSRMKHPPFHDDLNQVKGSINKILQTNAHKFYLGHGNPVGRELLEKYRDNFL